jgi:hypothetical protein
MIAARSPFDTCSIKQGNAHDTPLVARAGREKTKQMTNIGNSARSLGCSPLAAALRFATTICCRWSLCGTMRADTPQSA